MFCLLSNNDTTNMSQPWFPKTVWDRRKLVHHAGWKMLAFEDTALNFIEEGPKLIKAVFRSLLLIFMEICLNNKFKSSGELFGSIWVEKKSRFYYVMDQNLTFPWFMTFWTPGTPFLWIEVYQKYFKEYKKYGNVLGILFVYISRFFEIITFGSFGKGECQQMRTLEILEINILEHQ